MNERMEYSNDDADFVLTQESVRPFNMTQSSGYGDSILDGDQVVSLECNDSANFQIGLSQIVDGTQFGECDSIQIEDIPDDEAVDNM